MSMRTDAPGAVMKDDFIKRVAKRSYTPFDVTEKIIDETFRVLADILVVNGKVSVDSFGVFRLVQYKPRYVVPFGIKSLAHIIEKHRAPKFIPSRILRKKVW